MSIKNIRLEVMQTIEKEIDGGQDDGSSYTQSLK